MPNTTNFNFPTPADTDLVKDGASAIRSLGDSIDTAFVDLKGGTTGQILSKASNTDLDYTWIANDVGDITAVTAGTGISGGGTSGAVTITNSMATEITASGDIIVGTGSGTFDNLPIGTTGQVLTADTTVSPYKVKWATAGGGVKSMTLLNTGGTALTGSNIITISGISSKQALLVMIQGGSSTVASAEIYIRLNGDSTNGNYQYAGAYLDTNTPYNANAGSTNDQAFTVGTFSTNAGSTFRASALIWGTNSSSGLMPATITAMGSLSSGSSANGRIYNGFYNASASISSVSVEVSSGNWDAGTLYVYGMAA